MMENHFVFADLSTYELTIAKNFYSAVFNWEYYTEDGRYYLAHYGNKQISGLYETPRKFKDMNMPSFWMSYIRVESVEDTVARAKTLGGIIELVDTENPIGKVALIRDPLGAGFTVYEGDQLNSRFKNTKNALVWNELFISDFSRISPFYETLFHWTFAPAQNGRRFILDSSQQQIGAVREVSNTLKGKYEYWGVFFAVRDTATTKKSVLENGGSLVFEDNHFTALADPFGAFFHVVPIVDSSIFPKKSRFEKPFKWRASIGLGLIIISLVTGWAWIWGIFFTLWVIMDLRSGQTHLFEPISKVQHPVLFWVVLVLWAFLGVYSVLYYLYPGWFWAASFATPVGQDLC